MVTAGMPPPHQPLRENSHGVTVNQTRDLMISRQRHWPLDHEAGMFRILYRSKSFCLPFYGAWCTKHKRSKRISVNNENRNICLKAEHNYEFFKNVIYDNFNFNIYIYIFYFEF